MKKNNQILLEHILDAIHQVEEYTHGLDYESFCTSRLIQDAVIRNVAIIGEAVAHVENSLKSSYPNIPWEQIVSMRNIVTHEYFGVDLKLTWEVIQEDIPFLKGEIEKIAREIN